MSSPVRSASLGNASSYSAYPMAADQRPLRAFSSFEKAATRPEPFADFTNIPVRRSASQSMSTKGLHDGGGRFVSPRRTFSHDAIQMPHIVKVHSSEAKTCLNPAAGGATPADADLSLGGVQQLSAHMEGASLGSDVAGRARYKAMGDGTMEREGSDQGLVEVFSKMPD